MTTTATEQTTTTAAKRRPSRASRSAAASKPATKTTTSKASASKPAANPVTGQKQLVAAEIVRVVADALAANPPAGVSKKDALTWAGQWLQYLPGARQSKITWPSALGPITGAGAAK
jgi:hypothetical protein